MKDVRGGNTSARDIPQSLGKYALQPSRDYGCAATEQTFRV